MPESPGIYNSNVLFEKKNVSELAGFFIRKILLFYGFSYWVPWRKFVNG